jgi:hypothetical protein
VSPVEQESIPALIVGQSPGTSQTFDMQYEDSNRKKVKTVTKYFIATSLMSRTEKLFQFALLLGGSTIFRKEEKRNYILYVSPKGCNY